MTTTMKIGYPDPEPEDKTKPRCIVQQTLVYLRPARPTEYTPPFGTSPIFWGGRLDCRQWAKEKGTELNLPVVEIERKNPRLTDRDFEAAGLYVVVEEFDQWSPSARGRIFRY